MAVKIARCVVSIVDAIMRRNHIEEVFAAQGIEFQFFDAITPKNGLKEYMEALIPQLGDTLLSDGERGCFLSHLLLWKKCVDEKIDYLFVFEDDVVLSAQASLFLNHGDWLQERFADSPFLLRLETFLMMVKVKDSSVLPFEGRDFKLLESVHYGTAAYVISYQAAKLLYEAVVGLSSDRLDAVDELMFAYFTESPLFAVYQLSPAICVQEEQLNKDNPALNSQLHVQRALKHKNHKKLKNNKVDYKRGSILQFIKSKLVRALTKISREKEKRRLRLEAQEMERLLRIDPEMSYRGQKIIHFR